MQEFITLRLSKKEGTVTMIKDKKYFHQSRTIIKMSKPLLILLRMSDSNQPHMDKLRFMVLVFDDHIRMSMPELNNEDYFLPVKKLEYDEYEECPGDCDTPEYLSYDEDMSDTEDGIPYQDNNRLGWKILAVWDIFNPLLKHDYISSG